MIHKASMNAKERSARSRLAKLLHTKPVLRASIVKMSRKCGKQGCKCNRGEKHVSPYLSTSFDGKRKMIYIPPELEETVAEWVGAYQETKKLIDEISRASLDRLIKEKERLGEEKKEKGAGKGRK